MNKFLIVSILTIFLMGCSTIDVVKVSNNTVVPKAEGFYYALPRTVITVDITVTKTDRNKGVYAEYASKFLGIKNALLANVTNYELSDIHINSFSEPDPENFYFVNLSKFRPSKRNTLYASLKESGLIQDINYSVETSAINKENPTIEKKDVDYSETFKYIADQNFIEKIDTIFEKIAQDSTTIEKMILKKTIVEKSLEERAKEAADFIKKVKDQRFDILTGAQEVAYTDATIKVMISELERLEKEYLTLFIGTSSTETLHYRYYYYPESQVYSASIPLFKFSKFNGIVNENYEAGETVYIKVDRAMNTQILEKFIKDNPSESKRHGFYYRIPENAKFSIQQGKSLKAEASFLVSQFGPITSLPAKSFKIEYFPNTGGIKRIELL